MPFSIVFWLVGHVTVVVIFPGVFHFNVEMEGLVTSLAQVSKSSNSLPCGNDFTYYSTFKEFAGASEVASQAAASVLKSLLQFANPTLQVEIPDDLTDLAFFELVEDAIDALLDNVDIKIEAASGVMSSNSQSTLTNIGSLSDGTMEKPQLKFYSDIDNSRERPFFPRLGEKYHANVPWDASPRPVVPTADSEPAVVPIHFFLSNQFATTV